MPKLMKTSFQYVLWKLCERGEKVQLSSKLDKNAVILEWMLLEILTKKGIVPTLMISTDRLTLQNESKLGMEATPDCHKLHCCDHLVCPTYLYICLFALIAIAEEPSGILYNSVAALMSEFNIVTTVNNNVCRSLMTIPHGTHCLKICNCIDTVLSYFFL